MRIGDVELDATTRRVRVDGELVHLTPIEFDLVHYLAARPGRVSTREELLAQVWGYDVPSGARTVDSHIRTIRRKLGSSIVRTVHGVGYAVEEARHVRLKRPRTPERPLDPLPTLKLKISVIILAAVAVTVGVFFVGVKVGIWPSFAGVLSGLVALGGRVGARPRSDLAVAGDGRAPPRRWRAATSRPGSPPSRTTRSARSRARSTRWPRELAETDRLRRDLVANVSHELRTPITALQAVLENLVDGVGKADPETLRTMLAQVERLGRLVQQLLDLSRLESGTLPLDRNSVRRAADDRARDPRVAAARDRRPLRDRDRPARLPARSRRRAPAPGGREPRRERGAALAAAGHGLGPRGRRARRRRPARSVRRRPGHPRQRGRRGCSSVSTGPTPPARRATAAPDSAWRSRVGSSSCTAATSASTRNEPHGCRMIATIPGRVELSRAAHSRTHQLKDGAVSLTSIDDALRRIRRGEMVLVVDDEDRENEGDLTLAAEWVTPEAINFMMRWARGLVCMPCSVSRLDELEIGPMVPADVAGCDTAFTVSIDHRDAGSGIGAHDRALTIRKILDPASRPDHFVRPGHVFPLRAREGGVLERRGHTEAAVDLARLAGCAPVAVICEVLHDDGSPARFPYLELFARGAPDRVGVGRAARRVPRASGHRRPARAARCCSRRSRAHSDALLFGRADGAAVDDLVEVLGEPVAGHPVARPLGHALGDAGDELFAFGGLAPVAQRDEVEDLPGDLVGVGVGGRGGAHLGVVLVVAGPVGLDRRVRGCARTRRRATPCRRSGGRRRATR